MERLPPQRRIRIKKKFVSNMIVLRKPSAQYRLFFIGGFKSENIGNIRDLSGKHGIYVAFSCKPIEGETSLECRQIVYIGKAEGTDNLMKRITEHIRDDQKSWEEDFCGEGEFIVYCYAVFDENLHDIEAALIYKNQPLANVNCKDRYNGDAWFISIECVGEIGLLCSPCCAFRLVERSL